MQNCRLVEQHALPQRQGEAADASEIQPRLGLGQRDREQRRLRQPRRHDCSTPSIGSVNNASNYNLFFSPDGPTRSRFTWSGQAYVGIDPFRAATAQDANSIFADPRLISPRSGNLHVKAGSPVLDAGNPAYTANGELDIDGRSRPLGGGWTSGAGAWLNNGGRPEFRPRMVPFREDIAERGIQFRATNHVRRGTGQKDWRTFCSRLERGDFITSPVSPRLLGTAMRLEIAGSHPEYPPLNSESNEDSISDRTHGHPPPYRYTDYDNCLPDPSRSPPVRHFPDRFTSPVVAHRPACFGELPWPSFGTGAHRPHTGPFEGTYR